MSIENEIKYDSFIDIYYINNKHIDFEFDSRSWKMCFEGTSEKELTEKELESIKEYIKTKGFKISNFKIWFDNVQYFWRFDADLVVFN